MKRAIILLLLPALLIAVSCGKKESGGVPIPANDLDSAVKEADKAVTLLYLRRDAAKTFEALSAIGRQSVTTSRLSEMAGIHESRYGKAMSLQADYYYINPSNREISVFYTASNERRASYHRVVLGGNAEQGYKVDSMIFDNVAFEQYKDLRAVYKKGALLYGN